MNYITILEYIGVFAFSISGATLAIREKFDLFGILILSTVTAMGGGIIRDIVTDIGVPIFFYSYPVIPFIILGIICAILFRQCIPKDTVFIKIPFIVFTAKQEGIGLYELIYTAVDAVGLSAFVISAGLKAIENRYNIMLYLFCATITGVGGGIFRDILARRKPVVLQTDIYSVAGIIGAIVLWYFYPYMNTNLLASLSIITIFAIRMISYIFQINLPVIQLRNLNTE